MKHSKLQLSAFAFASACAAVSGCVGSESGDPEAGPPPLASGTLTVAVASDQVHYMLKQRDGMYVRLNLDTMKETSGAEQTINWRTASGSPVEVFGVENDDGSIDVDAMQPPKGTVQAESALVTTGTKRVLAIRLQFDGGPALGTEQDVRNTLDAAARQLDGSSFGKMKLEYDLTGVINVHYGKCDEFGRWINDAKSVAQNSGFDTSQYQHFMYFGRIDCGYAGMGGQPGDTTIIAALDQGVVVHELGHNFGIWHASSRTCRQNGATVTMSDDCTFDEYGDVFDPMGRGGNQHYNANYKVNLGWIPPSQIVTASGDQTITLAPMTEPSAGPQLLRVAGKDDLVYQVEYRQPSPTNAVAPSDPSVNGVVIHAFFTQAQDSGRALLLDMNPGGRFDDAPLGVGKSYNFFGTSTTLTVLSTSPSGAQLRISGAGGGGGDDNGGDTAGKERLVSAHSGKCVGVSGASTAAGAPVVQWPCNGATDQAWAFESAGDGAVVLRDANSGMCLDVNGASLENGAPIIQWPCHGGANQRWVATDKGNGAIALRSVSSGKCLDAAYASTADGAKYIQWDCHDGANQQFVRR